MIFENLQVTGSYQVSGSLRIPTGPSSSRQIHTGSLFFDTDNLSLEGYTGNEWISGSDSGSGGGGGSETPANTEVEYLVVAGGGAAGFRSTSKPFYMGGGGAGGLLSSSFSSLTSGSSYTITVGAGGAAYSGGSTFGNGSNGGNSSISGTDITTVTAIGGGRGSTILHPSSDAAVSDQNGADGGSGGGATGWNNNAGTGGSSTTGQGNDGGDGVAGENAAGAGGGGAGGAGTDNSGTGGRDAGDGGAGLQSSITGTSTYYAAGGRGGLGYSGVNGAEGADGTGYRGVANSGDGGKPDNTTAGESGVVILAYDSSSIHAAGGISGDAGGGKRYHQFNSSDSFVVGSTDDFNIVTDNLLVHYDAGDFSSRSTTTWNDLSGNGNNISTFSGPTLDDNWYYTFDGSNDYMRTPALTQDRSAGYAYELWVRVHSNQQAYIFSHDTTTLFHIGWRNYNSHWGFVYYHQYGSSNYEWLDLQSTSHSLNTWYHIVVTGDSTDTKTYQDGVLQNTTTNAPYAIDENEEIYIGDNYSSNSPLDGDIAQVRIYTQKLTAAEVLQNYNATKTNFV